MIPLGRTGLDAKDEEGAVLRVAYIARRHAVSVEERWDAVFVAAGRQV